MSRRRLPHDWFPRPLPGNVEIGDSSWIHSSYAFLHFRGERPGAVRIGRATGVYIDSFFDLGPDAEVEVGDQCTLAGPIFSTNGRIRIGDRAIVSREVVLSDDFATVPPGPARGPLAPAARRGPRRGSRPRFGIHRRWHVAGDDVWIGTRAVLLPGARLGDGAIVGAATVVDFAVPPNAVVAGNPARVVGAVADQA